MRLPIKSAMGLRDWGLLLVLSVLWGGSFFFVEIAIAALPTMTIVLLRVGLAATALWMFIIVRKLPVPRSAAAWRAFIVMGLLNNVIPFSLIVWGQTQIASGLASILNATTPMFTVIVAGALLADERTTSMKLGGVAVGFTGVTLMIGPPALRGLDSDLLAQLAVLAAAMSYAFAGVFGRRFAAMRINAVATAAGQVTCSSLLLAPIALYVDQPFELDAPGLQTWAAVVGVAVLSTAVAYVLYFRILASAGATNLLLVTLLIPVSAILLGALFLGETLELVHFVGMAVIGIGLSLIDGRPWRRRAMMRPARR